VSVFHAEENDYRPKRTRTIPDAIYKQYRWRQIGRSENSVLARSVVGDCADLPLERQTIIAS
jgi:hypothetical protein